VFNDSGIMVVNHSISIIVANRARPLHSLNIPPNCDVWLVIDKHSAKDRSRADKPILGAETQVSAFVVLHVVSR
jgi:hypothetical protein